MFKLKEVPPVDISFSWLCMDFPVVPRFKYDQYDLALKDKLDNSYQINTFHGYAMLR